ncbi:hypothetical protein LZC95_49960 [Pendulispora brunnea]|uniref:Uncharacterized protein n=1 Tax=Pendulispora brunnea TaxID=2905690 RepID=A0ABZ2K769_9BACT
MTPRQLELVKALMDAAGRTVESKGGELEALSRALLHCRWNHLDLDPKTAAAGENAAGRVRREVDEGESDLAGGDAAVME